MPPAAPAPVASLMSLIGVAIAPVALVTATSILLSAFSAKYANISDRMRNLTAEYRRPDTSAARRESLSRQIELFRRRVTAMWAAATQLSLALLAFLATVILLIGAQRESRLAWAGAATLLLGLLLMTLAVLMELYEIRLARLVVAVEVADID